MFYLRVSKQIEILQNTEKKSEKSPRKTHYDIKQANWVPSKITMGITINSPPLNTNIGAYIR